MPNPSNTTKKPASAINGGESALPTPDDFCRAQIGVDPNDGDAAVECGQINCAEHGETGILNRAD